jgi:hypothetical protein
MRHLEERVAIRRQMVANARKNILRLQEELTEARITLAFWEETLEEALAEALAETLKNQKEATS